jgi:hypothetical protein
VDPAKLRAWWWTRQGLDGSLHGAAPDAVLQRTGWARSVGGVNPYLTLFARAGTDRATVDAAVAELAIYELPAARGCTYVVPAAHFGLALQVGRAEAEAPLATLAKLGVDRAEIDALCAKLLQVLDGLQLDPTELKNELGDAVRSLGEEGRRRGASTTLPAALGLLQAHGEIRRVPISGRLDQQRYAYTRWRPPEPVGTDEQARVELARLYWSWTGAASMPHFRWFSAFNARQAKAAVADLGLVELSADGLLALPEHAAAFAEFTPPTEPDYRLLAGIDALILLRREVRSLLSPADAARPLPGGRAGQTLREVVDLEDHPIVDRGRIVGLWQYDAGEQQIVWCATADDVDHAAVSAEVARTEAYIRAQLGDARSFSLDSPASRAPRIAALRTAAAHWDDGTSSR